MTYINEANLYKCIFQSRKPEAEKFRDWVCDEVLPAIRKTGQYAAKPLTQGQMLVQMAQAYEAPERMLLEQQEKQREMQLQIHRLECVTDVKRLHGGTWVCENSRHRHYPKGSGENR